MRTCSVWSNASAECTVAAGGFSVKRGHEEMPLPLGECGSREVMLWSMHGTLVPKRRPSNVRALQRSSGGTQEMMQRRMRRPHQIYKAGQRLGLD